MQNIISSLKGKNTALDILTGIGLQQSQKVIVSQAPSPERNQEQIEELNEMRGDLKNFHMVIEKIQQNAEK